jgi:hypothetical protein
MFAGGIAAGGISAFATSLGSNVEAIQKPCALLIGQGVPASVADQMVNAARKSSRPSPALAFLANLKRYGRYGQTVGPTGKPGDPLHVVVTGQGAAAPGPQTPTAQTGHNPTKAPPMPGQVFHPALACLAG